MDSQLQRITLTAWKGDLIAILDTSFSALFVTRVYQTAGSVFSQRVHDSSHRELRICCSDNLVLILTQIVDNPNKRYGEFRAKTTLIEEKRQYKAKYDLFDSVCHDILNHKTIPLSIISFLSLF